MNSQIRLVLSALVAFSFYFGWSYWANSGPDIPQAMTLRSALVQGGYSAFVTVFFTFMLEIAVNRTHGHCFCLGFMVPVLGSLQPKFKQDKAVNNAIYHAFDMAAAKFDGRAITAAYFAPILPLLVQSLLVISVNLINQTPNLWLTVFPSILSTAIYGYIYTFSLIKKRVKT